MHTTQTAELKPSRGAMNTLKKLAKLHSKKLVITLMLVVAENIIYLLYPLMAGFAINAIIKGQPLHALLYALVVFVMWAIGAARRSMDTRTFARIYAGLAVPVILAQREDDHIQTLFGRQGARFLAKSRQLCVHKARKRFNA